MDNQTAQSLKDKAIADLQAGKLPRALKKARSSIRKFSKDADYRAIAGFVLTGMQQRKQSLPHFVEASRMKPGDPQFVENLQSEGGGILRDRMDRDHDAPSAKRVRTASIDQVRCKISAKSIGGWRNVAEHIQPMLDGIDPALWSEYDFS